MLTEMVEIWSMDPPRKLSVSRLAVGGHGLPVLLNAVPSTEVWNFPAAWELRQAELGDVGILFESWRTIMEMQFEIAQAQEDDAKERKANTEGERSEQRVVDDNPTDPGTDYR